MAWANDQETRRQSFITRRITKKEHDQWFSKVLADHKNEQLFILENQDIRACGQVRFSRSDRDNWEIHFSIGPEFRGQKLGAQMIRTGLDIFLERRIISTITAKVKSDNVASLKVLLRAGFQIKEKCVPGNLEVRLVYIPL